MPQRRQRLGHARLVGVADEIEKEDILPRPAFQGARLDRAQVDALPGKHLEALMERTGLVRHGEQDRGLVIPARRAPAIAADDQKAGHVVRLILNARGQHLQIVAVGSSAAGDGGGL